MTQIEKKQITKKEQLQMNRYNHSPLYQMRFMNPDLASLLCSDVDIVGNMIKYSCHATLSSSWNQIGDDKKLINELIKNIVTLKWIENQNLIKSIAEIPYSEEAFLVWQEVQEENQRYYDGTRKDIQYSQDNNSKINIESDTKTDTPEIPSIDENILTISFSLMDNDQYSVNMKNGKEKTLILLKDYREESITNKNPENFCMTDSNGKHVFKHVLINN